jgi:hypothetical protein
MPISRVASCSESLLWYDDGLPLGAEDMAEEGSEGEGESEWSEGVLVDDACDELDARFRETGELEIGVRVPGLAASWDIWRFFMFRCEEKEVSETVNARTPRLLTFFLFFSIVCLSCVVCVHKRIAGRQRQCSACVERDPFCVGRQLKSVKETFAIEAYLGSDFDFIKSFFSSVYLSRNTRYRDLLLFSPFLINPTTSFLCSLSFHFLHLVHRRLECDPESAHPKLEREQSQSRPENGQK